MRRNLQGKLAISIDGKRRRLVKRSGVNVLLHAVRGRTVCNIDAHNAIRTAAQASNICISNQITHL